MTATIHKFLFKAKFRANAYGWNGSARAITRLKQAVSEIKSVAKTDPVSAGEGVVALAERLWPALQGIDTSSGALGGAVFRTLNELIPILVTAPADRTTRRKWLERLFEAVQEDGVDYLGPIEERWGEIAQYPDLMGGYADLMIGTVREAWSDHQHFRYVKGTAICLASLLEGGQYSLLQELLALRQQKFWPWHRFGAEALLRQGLWEAAIAFAEAARRTINPGPYERSIDQFCETILIKRGRSDDAYRRYGLRSATGQTNIAIYRALVRTYPDRDRRSMLNDLIETRGEQGKWFAAAKEAGFLDIAEACASSLGADPATLIRAARDFRDKEPKFAAKIALLAISTLLAGGGYDPSVSSIEEAIEHLFGAVSQNGAAEWALRELATLAERRCALGREPFLNAIKPALARHKRAPVGSP